jgi:hypothetical protein
MCSLVETYHLDDIGRTLTYNFANRARVLHELPIRGQRLIQDLQQNGAIDTVVTNHDDRFAAMPTAAINVLSSVRFADRIPATSMAEIGV